MPVCVQVPLRIAVDPAALTEGRECLAEALQTAVLRALSASRKQILEPRAGYASVCFNPPVFTWWGDGLPEVNGAVRQDTEACIAAICSSAVNGASLYDFMENAGNAPQVMPGSVWETVDPSRQAGALGRYMLPFYDGPGDAAPVALDFQNEVVTAHGHQEYIWPEFDSQDEVTNAFHLELRVRSQRPPATGYLGAIFQWFNGYKTVLIYQYPGETMPFQGFSLRDITYFSAEPVGSSRNQVQLVEHEFEFPPTATYRLRVFRQVAGDADLEQALRDHYGPQIERELRAYYLTLSLRLSEEELRTAIAGGIEARINGPNGLKEKYRGATLFVIISVNDRDFLVALSVPLRPDVQCELIPLVDIVTVGTPSPMPGDLGTGTGGSAGGGGSHGTGASHGAGTGSGSGGPGGFVVTREAGTGQGSLFPILREAGGDPIECTSLLGEPAISGLNAGAGGLQVMVDDIAYRLQMPGCDRVGQFCVNAARVIHGRARAIGNYGAENSEFTAAAPAPTGTGNLGTIDFTPTASPGIQLLRHLADVVSRVGQLADVIDAVNRMPENRGLIQGVWGENPVSWALHFRIELADKLKPAVGALFKAACRIMILQLLRSSRNSLLARTNNFELYSRLFEQLVRVQLTGIAELIDLRDRLDRHETELAVARAQGRDSELAWSLAARDVTAALREPPPAAPSATGPPYECVRVGGEYKIRDFHNVLWSRTDLETGIATKRGTAEDLDPLVKQLTDIPEVVARLRSGSTSLRAELRALLDDMLQKNQEKIDQASWDPDFGFQAGRIAEDIPSASIPGTAYVLQGIHLQAHNQIGEFFHGSPWYGMGVDELFSARLGKESLEGFFEFTGLILLSMLCPGAGFLVGIALAASQYEDAVEREHLYQALIDPDLVLSRAEVEAGLFAAKLGLALAFIPEVGEILNGVRYGARAVARAGVSGGVRILGRYAVRRITKSTIEALARASVQAFVRELVTAYVLNELIQRVMEPMIRAVERETTVTGSVGGSSGASLVARMLDEERRAARQEAGH